MRMRKRMMGRIGNRTADNCAVDPDDLLVGAGEGRSGGTVKC